MSSASVTRCLNRDAQVRADIARWLRTNSEAQLPNGARMADFHDEQDGDTWCVHTRGGGQPRSGTSTTPHAHVRSYVRSYVLARETHRACIEQVVILQRGRGSLYPTDASVGRPFDTRRCRSYHAVCLTSSTNAVCLVSSTNPDGV
jgi:hypothetical protein